MFRPDRQQHPGANSWGNRNGENDSFGESCRARPVLHLQYNPHTVLAGHLQGWDSAFTNLYSYSNTYVCISTCLLFYFNRWLLWKCSTLQPPTSLRRVLLGGWWPTCAELPQRSVFLPSDSQTQSINVMLLIGLTSSSLLCFCLQCHPAESLKMFVPHCCNAINQIAVSKCSPQRNTH